MAKNYEGAQNVGATIWAARQAHAKIGVLENQVRNWMDMAEEAAYNMARLVTKEYGTLNREIIELTTRTAKGIEKNAKLTGETTAPSLEKAAREYEKYGERTTKELDESAEEIIRIVGNLNYQIDKGMDGGAERIRMEIEKGFREIIRYGKEDFKTGMRAIGEEAAQALASGYWGKVTRWRVWNIETLNALFGMTYVGTMIDTPEKATSFHTGGFVPDEGWFLGLKGEGVLNRDAMGRIGTGGLQALNEGRGVGNTIVYVIQAWDAEDVERVLDRKIIPKLREKSEAGIEVIHEYGVKKAV